MLLRLLSALPGPWLDLSDQVLAASGADAVRFSPVITSVEKMGAQSGGNPPEEGFTVVGTGARR